MAKLLLVVNSEFGGVKALLDAARIGNKGRIEKLLNKGVNIDYQSNGVSALSLAAVEQNTEIIQLLIGAGATIDLPDSKGYTPLLAAAYYDSRKSVKMLLDAGADPDWIISSGQLALTFCVYRNLTETAEIFLKKGANVNVRTKLNGLKNITPLYVAARTGKMDFVELYLSYKASVNMKVTQRKFAALRGASLSNSGEIIQLLIDTGADIDHQDIYGWTALYSAAYYGGGAAIRALVKNGANTTLATAGGSTPFDGLCDCTKSSTVADFCRAKACKKTEKLKKLLM